MFLSSQFNSQANYLARSIRSTAGTSSVGGVEFETDDDAMALEMDTSANDDTGGGLLNYYAATWTENCVFYANTAGKGGAAYNMMDDASSVKTDGDVAVASFVNVGFVANYASARGGGMANDAFTDANCDRCIFLGNACGGKGGGAYLDYTASPSFRDCAFIGNFAADSGGAIAADGSTQFLLARSKVVNNVARDSGGGVYLGTYGACCGGLPNYPAFHQVTFENNEAQWRGSGDDLYLYGLDGAELDRCLFNGEKVGFKRAANSATIATTAKRRSADAADANIELMAAALAAARGQQ